MHRINEVTLTCSVHMALLGTQCVVFHPPSLKKICDRFVREISSARLKVFNFIKHLQSIKIKFCFSCKFLVKNKIIFLELFQYKKTVFYFISLVILLNKLNILYRLLLYFFRKLQNLAIY